MSASASLTIPVAFATTHARQDAVRILGATAGASAVSLAPGGTASLGYEFPGNIDNVVRRLKAAGVVVGPTVDISVPVVNLSGRVINPAAFLAQLRSSPAVSAAAYDGATVTATIACATNAFRFVYEELIINGLMPMDVPTVAHPQEFVL